MSRLGKRRRQIQTSYLRRKLIFYFLFVLTSFILLSFVASLLIFAWYAKDLPSPGKLSQAPINTTVFLDRDGKTIYQLFKDKNRLPVQLADISPYLKEATVSIEDKNFYKHGGISKIGIIRAFLNIVLRRKLQGGSTITQQLIKNVLLSKERTLPRKIKEIILAIEVERRYTKDQILEMYLNEAPYGGIYWGVYSASQAYFGKQPKDLNLTESAILAGLPQSPTRYSPFIGKKNSWQGRAKAVLRRMREDGKISRADEKRALKEMEHLQFNHPKMNIIAPHFVFYVRDKVEKMFGPKIIDRGVKIKTTLDLDLQQEAQQIVKEEIEKLGKYKVGNGAVVVLDSQTGEILAMVGSYDFNNPKYGKFNAALGWRQPGSAIKPITYGLAFEKGYTPATVLMDVRTEFPDQGDKLYVPVDYDGKYRGPIQLRFGLANSINIPAVKLLAMIGIRPFLAKAYDMGLETFKPDRKNLRRFGLSLTLGGGETNLLDLTGAFSIFARGGVRKDSSAILEIKNFKDKVLFEKKDQKGKRVFSKEVSFLISHILSDNNARRMIFGPNSYLHISGKTVAVKTGTTDDKRDNWAVGYTNGVTIGVWVGNNDNSPMNEKIASGVTGASPIWRKTMLMALKKYPDGIIAKPDDVIALKIDAFLGGLPKDGYPTRSEYFIKGTEPTDVSKYYKTLKISKTTGDLANELEIKNGDYETKEFIIITEQDPVSKDGKNRWQEAIDKWEQAQDDPKYHPPTKISTNNENNVLVRIKQPGDKSRLTDRRVRVQAKITSLKPIKKIEIYINNQLMKEENEDKKEIDESFDLKDGVYKLKIVATNSDGKRDEKEIRFGVNKDWDYQEPTSVPTSTPTPSIIP